jgi:hypothetical protein
MRGCCLGLWVRPVSIEGGRGQLHGGSKMGVPFQKAQTDDSAAAAAQPELGADAGLLTRARKEDVGAHAGRPPPPLSPRPNY